MSQTISSKKQCFFLISYFLLSGPTFLSAQTPAAFPPKEQLPLHQNHSSQVSTKQLGEPLSCDLDAQQLVTDFINERKKVHADKQAWDWENRFLPDYLHFHRLPVDAFPSSLQLADLTHSSLAGLSPPSFHSPYILSDEELRALALATFCDDLTAALRTTKDPLPLVDWINLSNLSPFFQPTFHSLMGQDKYFNSIDSLGRYNLSLTPYAVRSKFRLDGSEFNLETIGATLSGTAILKDVWALGGGIGYWHSHLGWGDQMKNSNSNSFYAGPHFGYLFNQGYIDLSLIGVYNMYDVKREVIQDEETSNQHTGWDVLAQLDGGIDFAAPAVLGPSCFIGPKGNISYLAVWQNGYDEKGRDDLEASIDSRYFDFFRAFLSLDLRKEFYKKDVGFLIPSLAVGGVWMQPLSQSNLSLSCNTIKDQSYETTAQVYVGAKLTAIHKRGILLSFDFNAFIADLYSSYNGNIRFELDW